MNNQLNSNAGKFSIAIVGLGNIGRFAIEAVLASDDMYCAGVVRREAKEGERLAEFDLPVVDAIEKLGHVDVALLCVPSRQVKAQAEIYLAKGINTVDSFDIHEDILALKQSLDNTAKKHGQVAVVASGWDPGTDSMMRAMMLIMAPKGITSTNFGPGMSMGHSVAAKSITGVKDALSMTIPLGTGIHRRMVYIQLEEGASEAQVTKAIKEDSYFSSSETHVKVVDDIDALKDMGHGVQMLHKGVSGNTHNQQFMFDMRINNPALTSQIMVSAARASMRQQAGAYTMIEIPPVHYLIGESADWINKLV